MGTHESTVVVRMPDELKMDLAREAMELEVSISELIRLKLTSLHRERAKQPVLRVDGRSFRLEELLRPEIISYDYVGEMTEGPKRATKQAAAGFQRRREERGEEKLGRSRRETMEMSVDMEEVIAASRARARSLGNDYIGTEHLLLALLGHEAGNAHAMVANAGVDIAALSAELEAMVRTGTTVRAMGDMPLTKQATKTLFATPIEAKVLGDGYVSTEHLLLALMRETDSYAADALAGKGVGYRMLERMVKV